MAEDSTHSTDSEERLDVEAGKIAAIYADAYTISIRTDRLRISFAESLDGKAYYRTAISMPIGDAEQLSEDIAGLIKRYQGSKSEDT